MGRVSSPLRPKATYSSISVGFKDEYWNLFYLILFTLRLEWHAGSWSESVWMSPIYCPTVSCLPFFFERLYSHILSHCILSTISCKLFIFWDCLLIFPFWNFQLGRQFIDDNDIATYLLAIQACCTYIKGKLWKLTTLLLYICYFFSHPKISKTKFNKLTNINVKWMQCWFDSFKCHFKSISNCKRFLFCASLTKFFEFAYACCKKKMVW